MYTYLPSFREIFKKVCLRCRCRFRVGVRRFPKGRRHPKRLSGGVTFDLSTLSSQAI